MLTDRGEDIFHEQNKEVHKIFHIVTIIILIVTIIIITLSAPTRSSWRITGLSLVNSEHLLKLNSGQLMMIMMIAKMIWRMMMIQRVMNDDDMENDAGNQSFQFSLNLPVFFMLSTAVTALSWKLKTLLKKWDLCKRDRNSWRLQT